MGNQVVTQKQSLYQERVITAPIAVIKVNGVSIGKMKGIRINESIQRGKVIGLGSLTPSELPAVGWSGTLSCDFYNIDFRNSQLPGAIFRTNSSLLEWLESVCLQATGVTVNIYQRTALDAAENAKAAVPGTKIVGGLYLYATINNLFLDSEGFDLSEGQVSGRNQSFQYMEPILFIE